MISLTDECWKTLGTAYGGDATDVALALQEALQASIENPSDVEQIVFSRIWDHVCHQGSIYPALFATIPHLIEIASNIKPNVPDRASILAALGYAIVNAEMGVNSVGEIGDLDPKIFDCRESLRRAAPLIAETILCNHDDDHTAHLFATLAAIKGDSSLYFAMWGLFDDIKSSQHES